MRKRGTVSRCCCGDQSGVGVCADACVSSWNNCSPSSSGLLYGDPDTVVLQDAMTDAWNNCGWYRSWPPPNSNSAFVGNRIEGSRGDFTHTNTVPGFFGEDGAGGWVVRQFQFDYRTVSSIQVSYTSTLGGNNNLLVNTGNIVGFSELGTSGSVLFPELVNHRGFRNQTSNVASVTIGNTSVFTGLQVGIQITATLGDPVETTVSSTGYFNGSDFETATSCQDLLPITYELEVNGDLVGSVERLTAFHGIRCYAGFELKMQTLAPRFGTPLAQTSDMTISVT